MKDFDFQCIWYVGEKWSNYSNRAHYSEIEDWTFLTSDSPDSFNTIESLRILHEFNPKSDFFSDFKNMNFKEVRLFLGDGETPERFYAHNPTSEDLVELDLNANVGDFERKSREVFGESKKPLVIIQMHFEERKRRKNFSSKYSTF